MIITGEQSLPKPWHGDPSSSFLLWTKRAACDPLSTSQHTKALASLSHLILSVSLWTVGSRRYEEEGAGTHRRTVQKDLHHQDNHSGVITHLEPDILEREVKWALGSITTNKARGGDGIPVELFQILKGDAVKVLHSICQKIWKTQQWPQDWKRSVFIPIPKKGNAKYCHTTAQ